jgi:hypothetical protein
MRWFLLVSTLALAPTIVQAWQHGPQAERHRLRMELRRGWNDAMRDTRRAVAAVRREMRRAGLEHRRAIREAYCEARSAARHAYGYFRW